MLLLLCLITFNPTIVNNVDIIEINHYFGPDNKEIIVQMIFWDWDWDLDNFVVRDWRIHKFARPARQRGRYMVQWFDRKKPRRVYANQCIETWTYFDPEVANREILPRHYRKGLSDGW